MLSSLRCNVSISSDDPSDDFILKIPRSSNKQQNETCDDEDASSSDDSDYKYDDQSELNDGKYNNNDY